MSKAIVGATLLIAIAGHTPAFAQAAYWVGGAYGLGPPPACAFITTDRVKGNRFWDPGCRRWGSGIRPGVSQGDGILEGD